MTNGSSQLKQDRDKVYAGLTDKLGKLDEHFSDTVQSVADSVQSARDSIDLKLQVRRRPWTFIVGATALGFLGGFRMRSQEDTGVEERRAATSMAQKRVRTAKTGNRFDPEFAKLKNFALGTLVGLVREVLAKEAALPSKPSARKPRHNGTPL